ncbi:MAG: hypothetical protein GY866_20400 [Proteobacteria bacterium]|nr:hypothetical protein [Pseudomonadota bacterium]
MDDFDYLLCGIHKLKFDGLPLLMFNKGDGPEILRTHGEDKIHLEYINKMRRMVDTGYFDIVTHLDNHKCLWQRNEENSSEHVWLELMELPNLIKSKGMAVEINTSGTLKGAHSQFPSDNIVKELIRRNIPLTLCSDAHRPENVGYQFDAFLKKAKPWGLTRLCAYDRRRQRFIPVWQLE